MAETRPFPAYRGPDPHVFVCYAHADAATVYSEITRLHEGDVNIWYDEGIEVRQEWRAGIADALDKASAVLFYQSASSTTSKHCAREISYALDAEIPIVRINLDGSALPAALRLGLQSEQSIDPSQYSSEEYTAKLIQAIEGSASPSRAGGGKNLDRDLQLGGLIMLFLVPGLAVLGWLVDALIPMLGVSALVGFLGIGMLVAAKFMARSHRG